ncbi:hypothetical protein BGZ89_001156 [Linnemannia elongata]|nr:hypothetical protein BGZ89_001156 [Linnemannia elongata]
MSKTFSLPLECLELVIHNLADDSDINSLFNLLLVNKYVCSATLPILYEGSLLRPILNGYCETSLVLLRRLKLISTLLLGVPKTHITDLLRATYFQDSVDGDDQEQFPAPFAPYHSFARTFSLRESNNLFEGSFGDKDDQPPQRLIDSVQQKGLEDRYIAEAPLDRINNQGPWSSVTTGLIQELRRDLTWALSSNLEGFNFLWIPISDVSRYLPLVNRFKHLSHVSFNLDRELLVRDARDIDDLTAQERRVLIQQRDERIQHLNQMIVFVQDHQRCHKGVLRAADCAQGPSWDGGFPEQYEVQLSQLLPPLTDPEFIDDYNWARFAAKVKEINLSTVKSIIPPLFGPERLSLPTLLSQTSFLSRCRSLKEVALKWMEEDSMQWAVEERTQHDADLAAGRSPQELLVPLQVASVKSYSAFNGRLLNDLGYAFGNTLTSLEISTFTRSSVADANLGLPECLIGYGPFSSCWDAPWLCSLSIHAVYNFLRLHPSLLSLCPQLTDIDVNDPRNVYSTSDINYWEPADLRHLQYLKLQGTAAISFNPCTLETTPNLIKLELYKTGQNGPLYIPPLEELESVDVEGYKEEDGLERLSFTGDVMSTTSPRRSIWTWDWYLPKLTILELTSEIAYRFQFRMLEGTPNIEDCRIDIGNSSRVYNRVVQTEDFLRTKRERTDTATSANTTTAPMLEDGEEKDGRLWSRTEYIYLPAVEHFALSGPWIVKEQVLEVMFSKVIPHAQTLNFRGCDGFDLVEWVGSTSRHLNSLFSTSISVEVTDELLLEAGLELEPHPHFSEDSTYSLINHPETHDNPDRPALYYVDTDTSSTTNKYVLASLFKLIRILILSFPDDNAITDPLGVAYLRQQNVERWSGRAIYRLWGDFRSTFGLHLLRTRGPSVPRVLVRTTQDEDTLLKGIRDDADYVHCCSQVENIRLQGLQKFYLFGPWTFDKQLLAVLCSKMVPNVTHLILQGCDGFSHDRVGERNF